MNEKDQIMGRDQVVGRNEPCPCGSHKKYKRCCGVGAAPKLSTPKSSPFAPPVGRDLAGGGQEGGGGMDPSALENFDPQMLLELSQAMQKLPKGQLQRFQSIMQKVMSGQDVTAEANRLEQSLPLEFQALMHRWGETMGQAGVPSGIGGFENPPIVFVPESSEVSANIFPELPEPELPEPKLSESRISEPKMSEEQARELVAKAAQEGLIPEEEAASLLKESAENELEKSKSGGFFRRFSKK